jgi:hypothetical protein
VERDPARMGCHGLQPVERHTGAERRLQSARPRVPRGRRINSALGGRVTLHPLMMVDELARNFSRVPPSPNPGGFTRTPRIGLGRQGGRRSPRSGTEVILQPSLAGGIAKGRRAACDRSLGKSPPNGPLPADPQTAIPVVEAGLPALETTLGEAVGEWLGDLSRALAGGAGQTTTRRVVLSVLRLAAAGLLLFPSPDAEAKMAHRRDRAGNRDRNGKKQKSGGKDCQGCAKHEVCRDGNCVCPGRLCSRPDGSRACCPDPQGTCCPSGGCCGGAMPVCAESGRCCPKGTYLCPDKARCCEIGLACSDGRCVPH